MKKKFLFSLTLALAAGIFFACDKEDANRPVVEPPEEVIPEPAEPDEPAPVPDTRVDLPAVEKTNAFAFDFLQAVQVGEDEGKNLLLSPLSAAIPLAMLTNGAAGESLDNLLGLLGYAGASTEEMNEQFWALKDLASPNENVKVEQAASVWADLSIPVLPAFIQTMQKFYDAETKQIDFFAASALGQINGWVAERTHDRIPRLLNEIEGDVYLIHTLYFKGEWASPFNSEFTREEAFANADGSRPNVATMSQTRYASAYSGEDFDALELPYSGGQYNMLILLPHEGLPLSSVEGQLSRDAFDQLLAGMQVYEADVKLPKFKVEYERKLNDVLEQMAGKPLFARGDYSLLSPDLTEASVRVVQKTFAEVNEIGTEAAAATYVEIWSSSDLSVTYPKLKFHVNRPFLFLIHEKTTGAILFAGKILNL
jgi:serpin B